MAHETTRIRIRNYTKDLLIFSCVFVFSFMCIRVGWADAAVLSLEPKTQNVRVGETFYTEIRLNTQNELINAAEAHIVFPSDTLRVVQLERGGSILSLWPKEPSFDNVKGAVDFVGGGITAFRGENGLIGRVLFEATSPSDSAFVTLGSSSRVIIADGKGTLTKLSVSGASMSIVPARPNIISSPSHADENQWSRERKAIFRWEAPSGTQWSHVLTKNASERPDDTSDVPVGEMIFSDLEDGIYYFILKNLTTFEVFRWRIMIDGTPPMTPEVKISRDPTNSYSFLSFNSEDVSSGVKVFILCRKDDANEYDLVPEGEENTECREVARPLILDEDDLGVASLLLKAVDFAGNESGTLIKNSSFSSSRELPVIYLLLATILIITATLIFVKVPRVKNSFSIFFKGDSPPK